MCGLFGFSIHPDLIRHSERRRLAIGMLFRGLLVEDIIRGKDSAGAVVISEDGIARIKKKAIDGVRFVREGYVDFLLQTENVYVCGIGHNRKATEGQVNDRNAHPFGLIVRYGSVQGWDFGCHNGSFESNIHKILRAEQWEVDSETFLTKIARMKEAYLQGGVDSNASVLGAVRWCVRKVTENDAGSFAVLYIDSCNPNNTPVLYGFRNSDRPLWIFETASHGVWFCSTEEIFLKAWLQAEGILPKYDKEVVRAEELTPYEVYRVRQGKLEKVNLFSKEEIEEMEKKKKEAEIQRYQQMWSSFRNDQQLSLGGGWGRYNRHFWGRRR